MNMCIITGKVISPINFKFFYNSKIHISCVNFRVNVFDDIMTKDKNKMTIHNRTIELHVKAYDEKADYVYRYFEENDNISIIGWINQKMEVIIEEIEKE